MPLIISHGADLDFHRRDMSDKGHKPYPMDTKGEDLIREIRRLMGGGYALEKVRFFLGVPKES